MLKWLHIVFLFFAAPTFAQTASLVTDVNKIEIGDQIDLSIRFTFNANINPQEVIYPDIKAGKSLNDTIDIIAVKDPKIESTTDNQGKPLMIWQQDFSVGIYAGGNIQVGPFVAIYQEDTIRTNVTTIQVAVPQLEEDKGFVGIKDISTDPYTFWEKVLLWIKEHWVALLIVLLIIVGTILTAIYMRRKPEEKKPKGPVIPLPIQWMNQLEEIEKQQLWQNGKHKEYYIEVTGVIRKFIEYKYDIQALEQTSHEIIDSLRLSSIDPMMMNRIQNLFALSDLIKFAKSLPTPKENEEAMSIAKSILAAEIHLLDTKQQGS
ncbi:hypothetical protein [Parvicella tangerina]|uniref:Protein BatD n=1 Tax=Parvicella tangerina TaxID=2829795 RepID=A0A916JPW6_9FLAO|nr:hypothetical protein [Parvicella tangerina]CAG5084899.1 hypothetical protein CRYO30217_02595 [Parvicella tangerina]